MSNGMHGECDTVLQPTLLGYVRLDRAFPDIQVGPISLFDCSITSLRNQGAVSSGWFLLFGKQNKKWMPVILHRWTSLS
jgi:hypothetical protein